MSNSRQIASLPNILTLIDDAGGQFIKQQAAGVTTSYTITWPSAVGSSGAVLALTDGSGGLGWQSTLGIALSGGTVNNSVIGGSTPAAITGTTITANTAFVGPLTGNSTTATALASGRTFSFTGDATGTSASFDGSANVSTSLTLAASGVSAASYGSATAIPVLTVDAKGRITAATTAAISSTLTIGADSGSNDTVTIGTDTLNFVGTGSEIETTVSNNQIQIGLPSTVSGLTTVSATNLQGALAGTIASTTTGATQAASDNSTKIATTEYVTTALNNLIDSAPGALNTLNELAAAMGDDANFSTTVTNSIATKLPLAGGTLTGNVIFSDNVKALFGTGSDLEIYHDGSNSYLVDAGTGGILYRGGTQTFQNAAGSKTMAVLNGATSVDLYYDNSKKFETTSGGIAVTGTATATTFSATTLTGTLSTAAQPNVTSVGTLSSLTVSGALNATLATAAQTNITSLGTLTSLNVNGTATATAFSGPLTGNVTGNVSGSAATVTGAAQTAITSVGTLSALTVSGDVTVDTNTLKVDSSNNRVGILNASPDVTLDIGSATDSIHIPVGTTAQRPGSPAAGYFRYNSSLSQFEGYTSAWGAIGGGGTNTFNHNVFTGDGSTTAFALAATTESENNLLVFIDGVFQEQGAYSIATSGGTTTLTMSAAPASGRKLVVYQVSAGVSGNNLNIDTMTGDGNDVTLTLSIAPVNENNTQVFFDGVYQHKSTYSISGTTLTFSTAPPSGVAVEAMTFTQTEVNVPVNDTIDTVHIKDNAVTVGKLAASLNLSSNTITLPAVAIPSASTATTQSASDNSTKVATTEYVTTAIANLIDGAPGTMNTLNELAAALADDASFSSTITTSLAAKANLTGATFTGNSAITKETPVFTLTDSSASRTLALIADDNNSVVRASGPLLLQTGGAVSAITIDASQNVGIGTGSPASALDIRTSHTSTDVTAANSNQTLIVGNTGSGNGVYNAIKFAGNQQDMYLMSFNNSTQASRRLGFFVGSVAGDAVADERLSILGDGKVGIGTNSPTEMLHVQGDGADILITDAAGGEMAKIGSTGSNNGIIDLKNSSHTSKVVLNTNGDSYLTGGNVGIGTDSPASTFHVKTAVDNSVVQGIIIERSANSDRGYLNYNGGAFRMVATDGDPIRFGHASAPDQVSIDTSGNLLIGDGSTSAPSLAFYNDTDTGILRVTTNALGIAAGGSRKFYVNATNGYFQNLSKVQIDSGDFYVDGKIGIGVPTPDQKLMVKGAIETVATNSANGWQLYTYTDNTFRVNYNGAGADEVIIDSSGRVLIGKTSTGLGNTGVEFESGQIKGTAANQTVQYLNRTSSDGSILEFRKDNTTVGSIGSISSDLFIAESNVGLRFDGENSQILPASTTASTDGSCTLGASSARFLDLYLSGVARVGGVETLNGDLNIKSLDTSVNDGESLGALNFVSSDASTGGAGTQAKIEAIGSSSGTAYSLSFSTGSGASPTEKMNISPSGEVTISNNATAADNTTLLVLENGNSTGDIETPDTFIDFKFTDSNSNVTPQARIAAHAGDGGDANTQVLEGRGYLTFHTSNTSNTSGTEDPPERMRIASNGTTTVYGGVYSVTTATSGMFFTGSTDPFSFQKSGSHGYINNSAGGNIYMRMGSGFTTTFTYTSGGNLFFNQGDRINFYGSNFYVLNDQNAGVRLIDGNLAWQSQSDERIKENITDIGSVLSKIKDYRCVEYNLKSQDRKMYGFIAQDWETDFPHLVDEDENFTVQSDGTLKPKDEEGNTSTDAVKNLTYTETIPVLLKAIQEQQALIEALQTKVAALEGE